MKKAAASGIDFDQHIKGPDGVDLKEPDPDSRENPPSMKQLSLGAVCYAALMGPSPRTEGQTSIDTMLKVAHLASIITGGGVKDITVEQKKLILDRITRFPPAYVWGVVQLLDPAMIEKL